MRIARAVAPWLAIVLVAVILFPARWGGLFGITFVSGESMEPNLVTGDVAFTVKRPGYSIGDVIVYHPTDVDTDAMIIHRVIEVRPDGTYVTQGDNRESADRWYPTTEDIDGGVFAVLPKCTLSICGSMGWPFLLFTLMITVSVAISVFELVRNGLWPSKVVLPDLPRVDETELAWDRNMPPPGLTAEDVRAVRMLSAVLREEFVIHYEPSMSIRTGDLRAVEVHPRWHHAKHGLIKANLFLPMTEEQQLEADFDFWAARTGLRQVALWRRYAKEGLGIFIRLPRMADGDPLALVDGLIAQAAALDIEPEEIVLGIAPGPFMAERDNDWRGLEELADRGVDLCLHHFDGAGPEPLQVVVDSPVDYLTLDMSTTELPTDPDKSVVSKAVVRAANKGILVVGRQVDHELQLEALAEHGAVGFQGPLFAPPLAADILGAVLAGLDDTGSDSDSESEELNPEPDGTAVQEEPADEEGRPAHA